MNEQNDQRMIDCPLCDGTHENNSLCQLPTEGDTYDIC